MPRNPATDPASALLTLAAISLDDDTEIIRLSPSDSSLIEYVGGTIGTLSPHDISDYLAVFMETGSAYTMNISGTPQPRIFITDRAGYGYITIDGDDVPGNRRDNANEDSIFFFEPDFTGYHFIGVGPEDETLFGADLQYTFAIAQDIGNDISNSLTDDLTNFLKDPANPLLLPGHSLMSNISTVGDLDVVRVILTAGSSYVFELSHAGDTQALGHTGHDPTYYTFGADSTDFLRIIFALVDGEENVLASHSAVTTEPKTTFYYTATSSGEFDISIFSSPSNSGSPGTYKFTYYEDQAATPNLADSG